MVRYSLVFRVGLVLVVAFLGLYLCFPKPEVKAVANKDDKDSSEVIPQTLGMTVIPGRPKPIVVEEKVVVPGIVEPVSHLEPSEDSVTSVQSVNASVYDVYGEDVLELLAITIFCEAGGDKATDETRRMVGEVVLNRVASDGFPNTIKEVLLAPKQYGTFSITGIVWPSRAYSENEAYAVERAYKCAEMVLYEERLLPRDVVFEAEFSQGKEIVVHVPGFYFCR